MSLKNDDIDLIKFIINICEDIEICEIRQYAIYRYTSENIIDDNYTTCIWASLVSTQINDIYKLCYDSDSNTESSIKRLYTKYLMQHKHFKRYFDDLDIYHDKIKILRNKTVAHSEYSKSTETMLVNDFEHIIKICKAFIDDFNNTPI